MAKQATADAAAAEAFAEPKAKSGKKVVFFVIVPLLVLMLGAGGAAYYFLVLNKKDEAHAEEKPPEPPKSYVYYNLPEILVNLNGSNAKRISFLKMTVSLELDSTADVPRVQSVMPRIVNNMHNYLRELRPEDLRGTAALARARGAAGARQRGDQPGQGQQRPVPGRAAAIAPFRRGGRRRSSRTAPGRAATPRDLAGAAAAFRSTGRPPARRRSWRYRIGPRR